MSRKEKLLKKYMGEVKSKKQHLGGNSLLLRDDAIEFNESLSSDESSEGEGRKGRIHSSD